MLSITFLFISSQFPFLNCLDSFQKSKIFSYYECMDRRESGILESQRMNPKPLVVEAREIFTLSCIDCRNPLKPPEYWENKKFTWYYRLWQPDAEKLEVPLSSSRSVKSGFFIEEPYYDLVAVGANNSYFSGEYFCEDAKNNVLSNYDVDIVAEDPVKILLPSDDIVIVNEHLGDGFEGVEVATEWTIWTGCNRCGTVAERRRYGNCAVKRTKSMNLTRHNLIELFNRYPGGVPCRYSWLPIDLQKVSKVKDRPNYIQTQFCEFPCVTQPPVRFITERTKGAEGYRVIESIKRNRYSLREPIPRLPSPVLRLVRDTTASDGLALYCPAPDEEIYWKKGDNDENTVVLTTATLHKVTSDRMYVDEGRNLIFDYLEGEDQGIFSCWTWDGVLLMSATVNVAEPAKDALIITVLILTSIVIICAVGFYILWSSFKMKK